METPGARLLVVGPLVELRTVMQMYQLADGSHLRCSLHSAAPHRLLWPS
jgi:hypothetical protein